MMIGKWSERISVRCFLVAYDEFFCLVFGRVLACLSMAKGK